VEAVAADVREGAALADAMARHEGALPPAYVELVRAGLAAGNLPEVLLLLSRRLTLQQEFRRQVVDAFSYPLLVCVLALGVMFGVLILIGPSYRVLFEDFGAGLSWSTRTYLKLSAAAPTLLLMVLGAAALVALVFLATAGSLAGRRLRELLLSVVPYYRRMRRVAVSGELCASLAMFLRAGLTVPQAIRMAARTTMSERLGRAIGRACERVEAGEPLDDALFHEPAVPRLVVRAVHVGTSRGDLPEVLEGMAETYRRQGERAMAIARLVLPLVGVAFAGAAVGFAGLSLMLPLVQIIQDVRGV
jgi:type II secretory pathway component PulF